MTRYEAIYEELTERVESGELSLEDAEIINEAAAEKYLDEETTESYEDEFDPEEFDEAVDMCVDILLDEDFCETAEEYLDIMDMEMFSEAAKSAPYEKYMSQKAYEKMIVDALKKDTLEIPEKYAGDKKFVRAFTKDVQKAKKAAEVSAKAGGVKKAAAIAAAAAAVVGIGTAGIAADRKFNGGKYSDTASAGIKNLADRAVGKTNKKSKNYQPDYTPRTATSEYSSRRKKAIHKARQKELNDVFKKNAETIYVQKRVAPKRVVGKADKY